MMFDFSVLPDQPVSTKGIDFSALPDQPKQEEKRVPVIGELRDFYEGLVDTVKTVGVNVVGGSIGVAAGVREWIDSRSKEKAESVAAEVAKRYSDLYEPQTDMGRAVAPTIIRGLGIPAEIADEIISLPAESWNVPQDALYPVKVVAELAAYGGVGRGVKALKAKGADLSAKTIKIKDIDYTKLPDQPKEPVRAELDFTDLPDKPMSESAVEPAKVSEQVTEQVVPEQPQVEPAQALEGATGIKKAIVNAEREMRGLEDVEVGVRTELGEPLYDGVRQKVATGEINPKSVAQNLIDNPHVASPEEGAALINWRVTLNKAHAKAMSDIEIALNKGDILTEGEARLRLKQIEEEIDINDTAARQSSYQWGVSGKNMQVLMNEDFSLAAMIQRAKVDRGVKDLPPEVRAKYEKLSKELEEAQAKIAAHEETIAGLQSEKAIKRIRQEVSYEKRRVRRTYAKQELDIEFDALKNEFSKVFGGTQLHAGIDPTAAKVLGKMARNRVQSGIIRAADVVEAVYKAVTEMGMDVTLREVRDAISGYGKMSQPSQDALNIQLRDLRHQMRLVSALEDAQKGQPPLKSGFQRDMPSDAVRDLTRQVQQILKDNGINIKPSKTPEQAWKTAIQTFKTRARNRTIELERRISQKDFAAKPKNELKLDRDALDLQHKLDSVKKRYYEARYKDRVSRYNALQRAGAAAMEMLNFSRAVMTSMDLSAPLRQGAFIFFAHPIRGAKAMPAMFKALRSDRGRFSVEQEILNRDNYPLYEKSGLYLAEHGQKLSQMEEVYMSRMADKVPGVGASQRAYTTFLNRLRADSFDAMLKNLTKNAKESTLEERKAIANYINIATGRGSLGLRENALTGLNTIFFAPRYVASRFQMVVGQPFFRGNARTRWMVAKEYARFLTGLGVVYSLGLMAGAELETDPRSSDFGKLKFGDTRLDPMGGLSQSTVLLARVFSGTTKNKDGDIIPLRDNPLLAADETVPYGKSKVYDVIARFMRTKFSPIIGSSIDIKEGRDVVGNKVTLTDIPQKMLIPLAWQDVYDTMQEQGVPAAAAFSMLALFGMGLQNYGIEKEDDD